MDSSELFGLLGIPCDDTGDAETNRKDALKRIHLEPNNDSSNENSTTAQTRAQTRAKTRAKASAEPRGSRTLSFGAFLSFLRTSQDFFGFVV